MSGGAGVLDKDALAHLIDEYPSMRDTVRGALTTLPLVVRPVAISLMCAA